MGRPNPNPWLLILTFIPNAVDQGLLLVAAADSLFGWDGSRSGAIAAPLANGDWLLERVTLTDGKTYQGLVQLDSRNVIDFLEVRRPPGKPMSLVVRPIEGKAISKLERLKPVERECSRASCRPTKTGLSSKAAVAMTWCWPRPSTTECTCGALKGVCSRWRAPADEQMTSASSCGWQIFTAYRQVLAPRRRTETAIQIRVFGAGQEHRGA